MGKSYKDLYIRTAKELYALKLSINPYWKGTTNRFYIQDHYTLDELKDLWFECVELEAEDFREQEAEDFYNYN